jgi:O-antigen ligase/tetratricopeptide (TPR) repeat protein
LGIDGAWYAGIYGVAFWVMLRRGFTFRELRTLAWLFVLLGAAALFFLAAQRTQWLLGRWITNPFDDIRNRMGTLLGHNTAAASFLLLTSFMAFALFLTSTVRWRQAVLLLYLAAAVVGMLMMQSRSIWALGPVLVWLAWRNAMRTLDERRWRHLPTALLLMVAIGLVTQTVDRPWNPLFVRDNPFASRLKTALSKRGVVEESRVRLNAIGIRLVPDAPLIGQGMYAFQYVYARKQGEYFLDHPGSVLNRTLFRSHMAHNEYLQIWIEQGTIGLGLCIWMYLCLWRAGGRRRRELACSDHERLLHAAFGWGALAIALHAFFDFPFHIPQLALPALVCMAGWAAPWRPLVMAAARARGAARHAAQPAEGLIFSTEFRPQKVARLVSAIIVLAAVPFMAMPLARMMRGDVLFNEGSGYMSSVYDSGPRLEPARRADLLKQAMRCYEQSERYAPSFAMTDYRLSEACAQLARMSGDVARNATLPPDARQAAAQEDVRMNQVALGWLERAARGLDYYMVYYMRGEIYRELAALAEALPQALPKPAATYRREYQKQLELTLRYAPNLPHALQELADLLARDPNGDAARVTRLRALLYKFDPGFFENTYAHHAYAQVEQQRYERAAQTWDDILAAAPPLAEWAVAAARANLMLGRVGHARQILLAAVQRDPDACRGAMGGILLAGLAGDWLGVLLDLNVLRGENPVRNARLRAIEEVADARLGRINYATRYPRPEDFPFADWQREVSAARADWLMLLQDWIGARRAFDERLTQSPPPPVQFWISGLYLARQLHDAELEQQALDNIRQLNPNAPILADWAAAR